jgi:hypothetical protein
MKAQSSDYAEHLLDVVRSVHAKERPSPWQSQFILNGRAPTPKLAAAVALIALCIIVPISTINAQAPPQPQSNRVCFRYQRRRGTARNRYRNRP